MILSGGAAAGGPFASLAEAREAGAVTLDYGLFINTVINFLIVAFAVFMVIRSLNKLKREAEAPPAEPSGKECPYCRSAVPIKATKCAHCTSALEAA